jgi:hypothetical protein
MIEVLIILNNKEKFCSTHDTNVNTLYITTTIHFFFSSEATTVETLSTVLPQYEIIISLTTEGIYHKISITLFGFRYICHCMY